MCCMFSFTEKTKSRVTFFFPTLIFSYPALTSGITDWANMGFKDPHRTDKANLMCRVSDQHSKATILQSDLCSMENLSQFCFVFLTQSFVLYVDTHNQYESRSRRKEENGRKQRRHMVTEWGRVAGCKWMAIHACTSSEIKTRIAPATPSFTFQRANHSQKNVCCLLLLIIHKNIYIYFPKVVKACLFTMEEPT